LLFGQNQPITASVFHQDAGVYKPVTLHLRDGRTSFVRQSALARLRMTTRLGSRICLAWKESPKVTTGHNAGDDHPALVETRFIVVQDHKIDHDFVLGNRARKRRVVVPPASLGSKGRHRAASQSHESLHPDDTQSTTGPWRDDRSSESEHCRHERTACRRRRWTEAVNKVIAVIAVCTVVAVLFRLLDTLGDLASGRQ
jgi:hypothetical protein